jgi:CBS domain-containing protein
VKRNPQVLAFMTPFPYAVDLDAPLAEAHDLLRQHPFRHLPVTSGGAIVGMLTDRDISLGFGTEWDHPGQGALTVRDAHVEAPCIVAASTPVARVARLLAEQGLGAAIVTKHDKLVGIFTVTDACRALAEVLGDHEEEPDDAA